MQADLEAASRRAGAHLAVSPGGPPGPRAARRARSSRPLRTAAAMGLALMLAGCGGGGSDTAVAPPPPSTPPTTPPPSGQAGVVFALLDPGDAPERAEAYARLSSVDGIAFRVVWSTLEPASGSFRWTTLDSALDVARRQGKTLTLHVAAAMPPWLSADGARTYSYTSPIGSGIAPIPWDSVYLTRYSEFVSAMAAHIRARGDEALLNAVSVGVPVSEMSIPGCTNGQLAPGEPYDRAQYLQAWKTAYDAHLAAFPSTPLYVSAPVSVICRPDNDGKTFYGELMTYALGRSASASVIVADLNALGSQRLNQVDASILSRSRLAAQTIWSFTNDPTNRMQGPLLDAICSGRRSGARYFELYKSDLDSTDPAVQAAVGAARSGAGC